MEKFATIKQVATQFKDGMSIMIGGFLDVGAPLKAIDALMESGVRNLTVIAVGAGYPGGGFGLGNLAANGQIKTFITTHIGTVPQYVANYNSGKMAVEFYPMGTWIERIRAGGAGLGGVLTATGLETEVEKGRRKIDVDGKTFLLFPPLRADLAVIKGYRADNLGNIEYRGAAINTNPVMATAADHVIAEVDEIVETGTIRPQNVGTPATLVGTVIQGYALNERKKIYTDLWVETRKLA